jgi:arylsulfatase A-like enzyme
MADDLGYGDLGCYGQKFIQTPNLDRMAAEGLRFTRFHAGYALCLPSRCALMTGLHTGHSRCRVNQGGAGGASHPELAEQDTTIATVLKAAGYRTGMVGKWALGDRFAGSRYKGADQHGPGAVYKHGWDFYVGEPNQSTCHDQYVGHYRYDPAGLVGEPTPKDRLVPFVGGPKYAHDRLAEQALAFIDAAKDSPFFLYVPTTLPHFAYQIPEIEPYAQATDWSDTEKIYASMITRVDRDVGRILDRLKARGIDENTLVIFTSDNGPANVSARFNSQGGLVGGKGSLSPGGLIVPTIARWPGAIKAGSTSDYLGASWDMMPTFSELAGIRPPAPIDGLSLVPTLTGKGEQAQHRYLYFTGGKQPGYVVRSKSETRDDKTIAAEADTEVVVPQFAAKEKK